MAIKMAAVQGKVTAFIGLTKEKYIAQAIRYMATQEIKRRLIDRRNRLTKLS